MYIVLQEALPTPARANRVILKWPKNVSVYHVETGIPSEVCHSKPYPRK